MNEKTILGQTFTRGKHDAIHKHPGPDAVDVADFVAQILQVRDIPDFGNELDPHGNIVSPIDTSAWTEEDWTDYRQKVRQAHSDVSDAYARGADAGRAER